MPASAPALCATPVPLWHRSLHVASTGACNPPISNKLCWHWCIGVAAAEACMSACSVLLLCACTALVPLWHRSNSKSPLGAAFNQSMGI